MDPTDTHCPDCGNPIPEGAPLGMCPECLLGAGLDTSANDATIDGGQPETAAAIGEPPAPGMVIGRYKLLQQIGEGGFGVVYMAEQTEPVKRRVALKVIKAGMDSREIIARFEAERQALALMDHPNIAKIHDAGTTEAGRPYFVMELVKGIPITKYCADQQLDTKARLELFTDVCAAVQHAHQKGIIHRDLKPSNILVSPHDGKPVVKVIDFGIAKAISMELSEKTMFTRLGQMMGTPQYMSPEQAELNAFDIDTRSDIYSLGVVLYELLTGTTPLDGGKLRSAAYGEMQRLIREETPAKPSTRISTLREQQPRNSETRIPHSALSKDLDWITMMALEKDRARRYETASSFAADIERFLADEPVMAGAPSASYRIGKFVKRYRRSVVVAATIAILLVAGILGTSWFALSSQQAEKREREAKDLAIQRGEETKAALKQSRYEEAKAWLERARLKQSQNDDFAAAMMAAKGLGFRGVGAERQSEEFRRQHPVLLDEDKPEFGELRKIVMSGGCSILPIWQSTHPGHHLQRISSVTFSPDGTTLASGSFDDTIKLWDVSTGREKQTFEAHRGAVTSVAFSPDGSTLASGSYDKTIKLWEIATGNEICSLQGHQNGVTSVAFSPDGKTLATGSLDNSTKLWDTSSGKEIRSFVGHDGTVYSVAFSPNGHTLASGCGNKIVKLWDTSSGKEIRSIGGHEGAVFSVAFSPDGATLATGGQGPTVTLWNVSTGEEIRILEGHLGRISSVNFSPDGNTLASGSEDNIIKLWDVSTGKESASFNGHPDFVTSVAFSPGGKTLASGSYDKSIKLWAIPTGKEIRSLGRHGFAVYSVSFSPDGATLATGSQNGILLGNSFSDPGVPGRLSGGVRGGATDLL